MGKIKSFFQKAPLKTAFSAYIILCLATALLFSLVSCSLCQLGQSRIYKKYQQQYYAMAGIPGQIILENGTPAGGELTFFTQSITTLFTPAEKVIYQALDFLNIALVPVWFALCIGATGALFYKHRLQTPLALLNRAADNIANNDLDFTLCYDRPDEMGRLCASFEKMRGALQQNNLEMWRLMEERKRLNAAFSHDLRTPLTVLKGQSEMLLKYVPAGKLNPEKVAATAGTMKAHVTRLENYVEVMTRLQRLEDIQIEKALVTADALTAQLSESGRILCGGKRLVFDAGKLTGGPFELDLAVVSQVYENLLANAARFAQSQVTVKLAAGPFFSITVLDDGPGFAEKALAEVTKPFYKTDNSKDSQHFGMGLHICKILCEKHGGCLTPANQKNGGACVKAVF